MIGDIEEKNFELLRSIIDKKTTIENVIFYLQKNRFKLPKDDSKVIIITNSKL